MNLKYGSSITRAWWLNQLHGWACGDPMLSYYMMGKQSCSLPLNPRRREHYGWTPLTRYICVHTYLHHDLTIHHTINLGHPWPEGVDVIMWVHHPSPPQQVLLRVPNKGGTLLPIRWSAKWSQFNEWNATLSVMCCYYFLITYIKYIRFHITNYY